MREKSGQSFGRRGWMLGGGWNEGKKRVESGSREWLLGGGVEGEKRAKLIRAK